MAFLERNNFYITTLNVYMGSEERYTLGLLTTINNSKFLLMAIEFTKLNQTSLGTPVILDANGAVTDGILFTNLNVTVDDQSIATAVVTPEGNVLVTAVAQGATKLTVFAQSVKDGSTPIDRSKQFDVTVTLNADGTFDVQFSAPVDAPAV